MNTTQDTITAADLDTKTNTGRVYAFPPQCPPCHGQCHQGRQCNAEPIAPAAGPRIVPCSTIARLYLALRLWWRG